MPIIVRSPYSGQPVKVRDQDLGRAIRDEEGRVFYVVERSEGGGYYAAPTRKGSAKDEQRYLEMESKVATQDEVARASQQQPALHDATGPGRPVSRLRVVVLVLVLLALIVAAGLFLLEPDLTLFEPTPESTPEQPMDEPGAWRDVEGDVAVWVDLVGVDGVELSRFTLRTG